MNRQEAIEAIRDVWESCEQEFVASARESEESQQRFHAAMLALNVTEEELQAGT